MDAVTCLLYGREGKADLGHVVLGVVTEATLNAVEGDTDGRTP